MADGLWQGGLWQQGRAGGLAMIGIGQAAAAADPWQGVISTRNRTPHARLCCDARGRDGGIREELAAGVVLRSEGRSAFRGIVLQKSFCTGDQKFSGL